jgi:chorismate mutase
MSGDPLPDSIDELRAQIDAVDDAIATALARRRALVGQLRAHKAERGIAFLDPGREAAIEDRYRAALPELPRELARALARAILEASR